MSWWLAVLAWLGLAQGAFTLVVVALLLNRVSRPIGEIGRLAGDILRAGDGIAHNLAAAPAEAARTHELTLALAPPLKAKYGDGRVGA